MLDPYKSSSENSADEKLSSRARFVSGLLWWLGYALQFALFAGFMESWLSDRAFFNSRSDSLKFLLFGLPMIVCGMMSVLVVLFMVKHWSISKRIWLALATVAMFGATWFGFWVYMLLNLYARMRN
jgi:drug/metabolite transporter (DMT)-like permease